MNSPLRRLLACACATALAGCAGGEGPARLSVYEQTVRADQRARLGDYRTFSTRRGCPTVSLPEISVLREPAHGRLSFGVGPARYVADKPVSHPCERGRGTASIVYYTPRSGYRGVDDVAYRVRFFSGETQIIRKRLLVR